MQIEMAQPPIKEVAPFSFIASQSTIPLLDFPVRRSRRSFPK